MKKIMIFMIILIVPLTTATLDTYLTPDEYREMSVESDTCDFLSNLINNEYEIICVNELIALCNYDEDVIIVGDIDSTDIYFLVMFTFHEYGHLNYGMNEEEALVYGLEKTNEYERLINLYRWVNKDHAVIKETVVIEEDSVIKLNNSELFKEPEKIDKESIEDIQKREQWYVLRNLLITAGILLLIIGIITYWSYKNKRDETQ